jgi:hypothetical protein
MEGTGPEGGHFVPMQGTRGSIVEHDPGRAADAALRRRGGDLERPAAACGDLRADTRAETALDREALLAAGREALSGWAAEVAQ